MTDEPKRYRGQRGPNRVKKERMKSVSIRLPQQVLDYYDNSTVRMRQILVHQMNRIKAMDDLIASDADLI